jgi:hypothetical protein
MPASAVELRNIDMLQPRRSLTRVAVARATHERLAMRFYNPPSRYTSSVCTDVAATWKRFGFKPTTAAERRARQRPACVPESVAAAGASVTKLNTAKRKAHAPR